MTACIASPLRTPMKTLRFDKYTFDMLVDRPSPTLYIDYSMGVRRGEAIQAVAYPFLDQERLLMAKFQSH